MKNDSIENLNAFILINHRERLRTFTRFASQSALKAKSGGKAQRKAPIRALNSMHYLYFYLQNKPDSLIAKLLNENPDKYNFNNYPDAQTMSLVDHDEHRASLAKLSPDLNVFTTTAMKTEYNSTKQLPDATNFGFDDVMMARLLCRQGTAASQSVRRFLGEDQYKHITDNLEKQIINALHHKLDLRNIPELTDLGERMEKNNPVLIGREDVIDNIIDVMMMKKLNNPILVGPAGVGKSAIMEYLAWQMHTGEIDPSMRGHQILEWDLAEFMSDTAYVGETEKKFRKIVDVVKDNPELHLFMDEIHNVVGAGASSKHDFDVSNMLKKHLANGSIQMCGATTEEEYDQFIKPSKAFSRRFNAVPVKEPNAEQTVQILTGSKGGYEKHHGIYIPDEECVRIVEASRTATGHSPAREFVALDRACVRSRRAYEKSANTISTIETNQLKRADVDEVLARQTRDRRSMGFTGGASGKNAQPVTQNIVQSTVEMPHNSGYRDTDATLKD